MNLSTANKVARFVRTVSLPAGSTTNFRTDSMKCVAENQVDIQTYRRETSGDFRPALDSRIQRPTATTRYLFSLPPSIGTTYLSVCASLGISSSLSWKQPQSIAAGAELPEARIVTGAPPPPPPEKRPKKSCSLVGKPLKCRDRARRLRVLYTYRHIYII